VLKLVVSFTDKAFGPMHDDPQLVGDVFIPLWTLVLIEALDFRPIKQVYDQFLEVFTRQFK
jgi:hypothetical protein